MVMFHYIALVISQDGSSMLGVAIGVDLLAVDM